MGVYGETSSMARHDELRQLGVIPTVRADRGAYVCKYVCKARGGC